MLRTNPTYHAAEVLRRNTQGGSGAMAAAKEGSPEHQAVLLLIGTWETIAVMVSDLKKKDKIFAVTPICHMHRELKDAIDFLAKNFPGFAANFTRLAAEYDTWLKKKKLAAQYESAICGGLHARFG